MLSASLSGLVSEGLATSGPAILAVGLAAGVVLVVASDRLLSGTDIHPRQYEEADFKKLVLILGVLTVHSFPEGVAIGVSFADLSLDEGIGIEALGVTVPVLAVFITGAIAIRNVPEGIAVAIPLQGLGVPRWRMVWWAVFSSLPYPVGAALAYLFVQTARDFLSLGFAAGAMIYLIVSELVPEARSIGRELPRNGTPELIVGLLCGVLLMLPLSFV